MRTSLLALLLAASASAQSTVVLGNMGADGEGGFATNYTLIGSGNVSALGFNTTDSNTLYLESITIGSFIDTTGNFTLTLWNGTSSQPVVLAHTSSPVSLVSQTESKFTYTFNTYLAPSTIYWVIASEGQSWATSQTFTNAVEQNNSGYEFVGNIRSQNNSATWSAFIPYSISINASAGPIPEPSTYGLILGGLALAGAAIRRRQKAAK